MASKPARVPATYYPIEWVENMERYRPGGYHPVLLGDTMSHGRYKVFSKLGYGGYSTVWLANDKLQQRFVALKIVIASATNTNEREIRQLLARADKHPGSRYVQRLFDAFLEQGPNGTHNCLASEPCAMSLDIVKDFPEAYVCLFPLEVARAIAAQMILATAFVHSQGVVHGDLHVGNFLLRFPPHIASLTVEQYTSQFVTATEPVQRFDRQPLTPSAPPYVVFPTGVGEACHLLTLADAGVLLTDFGVSWMPAKQQQFMLGTPLRYLPPESLFSLRDRCPLGPAVDIWTLAHSIYFLFSKTNLTMGICRDSNDTFSKAIGLLGLPPRPWWDTWSARDTYFNSAGQWEPKFAPRGGKLADRVRSIRDERKDFDNAAGVQFGDGECADFGNMLQAMLAWEPKKRISSRNLAKSRWMRSWGTPALNKVLEAQKNGSRGVL